MRVAGLLRRKICSTERVVKPSKLVLLVSLLNLGVVAGLLYYVFKPAPTEAPVAAAANAPAVTTSTPPAPAARPETRVVVVTNQFQWAQIESEDYHTYIARLRSIGCPEQTVRDIIIADLDKLLAPEMVAAQGRRKDLKYWHPEEEEMLNDIDPREVARKQRDLDKRKRDILRELVGADLLRERMKSSGQEDYYERRLGFLGEERRTQVRELLEKFDDAQQRIQDKAGGDSEVLTAAQRSQLRILRQQREEEVARLMSPEEKKQFDLWLSPTANGVRHALYGMDASEREFQTIYEARKAYDEAWAHRDPDLLDAATRQRMDAARADMEGQIEQELGPERYTDYKRGQDDEFHLLNGLVTRFKLPREKAAEVYGYKVVATNYRQQVLSNAEMTPQQKDAALKSITEETRKTVSEVLGARAFAELLRNGQGRWMGE